MITFEQTENSRDSRHIISGLVAIVWEISRSHREMTTSLEKAMKNEIITT